MGSLQKILDEQIVGIPLLVEIKRSIQNSLPNYMGGRYFVPAGKTDWGRWTVNCCEAWSLHISDD